MNIILSLINKGEHFPVHYLPMQYTEVFSIIKKENFIRKIFDISNIDCGYTIKLSRRGGSNEYPQSMFWIKNKKNRYTPANPCFTIK